MSSGLAKLINRWPDFIVTFFSILLGGLVAFWIAKWQVSKQNTATILREKELLSKLFGRVKIELQNNRNRVKQLQEALGDSKNIRVDILEWAITIIDSFSSNAYAALTNLGLQRNLPQSVELTLYNSYDMINNLAHMVKQTLAEIRFFWGYGGGNEKSDILYENIKNFSQTVLEYLENAVKIAYEYDEKLSKGIDECINNNR